MRASLVVLIVVATAIGPSATSAAASWSGVEPLPADASSTPFDMDTNARGDSIAVYEVASSVNPKVYVVAAYRRAGRAWEAHTLGETLAGADADSVAASIDGQGRAAIAWLDGTASP